MLLAALLAAAQLSPSEPASNAAGAAPDELQQRPELAPRAAADTERRATLRSAGIQGLVGGVLVLGIGAGCMAGAAGTATALREAPTVMAAMQLRDQGKGWQVASGVVLTLGVAVVITAVVLLVLGADPAAPQLGMLAGMWP